MTTDHDTSDFEPPHASSPTDRVLTELQLYGHRPFQDEPDPRPLPDADAADQAADQFVRPHRVSWRPRAGSMVNHRTLTAAMIDSRDFLAAKRRAETEPLLPPGPKVAFTGGLDFSDHRAVRTSLDKVHAKHPDMVLLHGGSPKGAERIAACWADNRKVRQIAFKPDWTRHAKAAPFKRNDQMLAVLPIGVIAFPGSGISANLADKARKLGIPVWRFSNGRA
jgi:hypothetical protein